jgi:hypothetical protein
LSHIKVYQTKEIATPQINPKNQTSRATRPPPSGRSFFIVSHDRRRILFNDGKGRQCPKMGHIGHPKPPQNFAPETKIRVPIFPIKRKRPENGFVPAL